MSQAEREICARLKLFREGVGWNQNDFAGVLGISLNQLAGIEYARTPLQYRTAWKIRERFKLSLAWLVGDNYPPNTPDIEPWPPPEGIKKTTVLLSEVAFNLFNQPTNTATHSDAMQSWWEERAKRKKAVPDRATCEELLKSKIEEWLSRVPEKDVNLFSFDLVAFAERRLAKSTSAPVPLGDLFYRAFIQANMRMEIRQRLGKRQNQDLQNYPQEGKTDGVKPILPKLIERLKKATKERGQKTELASWLGVSPQKVTDWLSQRVEPSGETTLQLLNWVEQRERQK